MPVRLVIFGCLLLALGALPASEASASAAAQEGQDSMRAVFCKALNETTGKPQNGPVSLGVAVSSLTSAEADQKRIPDRKGAFVQKVVDCSPADIAGVENGDVIREFNGQSVANAEGLPSMVRAAEAGSTVALVIIRDGHSLTLHAVLGGQSSSGSGQNSSNSGNGAARNTQADADKIIIPGQRIGPVALLSRYRSVMTNRPGASVSCETVKSDTSGTTTENDCQFKNWGLEVHYVGAQGWQLDESLAVEIQTSGTSANRYATSSGIRIGTSENAVTDAYGAPSDRYNSSNGPAIEFLEYNKLGITFAVSTHDHTVLGMQIYSPGQGN